MPVDIRKAMGLKTGDKLEVIYDAKVQRVEFKKPLSIDEISTKLTGYIEPGIKPLHDVDAYYQKHRRPRL